MYFTKWKIPQSSWQPATILLLGLRLEATEPLRTANWRRVSIASLSKCKAQPALSHSNLCPKLFSRCHRVTLFSQQAEKGSALAGRRDTLPAQSSCETRSSRYLDSLLGNSLLREVSRAAAVRTEARSKKPARVEGSCVSVRVWVSKLLALIYENSLVG